MREDCIVCAEWLEWLFIHDGVLIHVERGRFHQVPGEHTVRRGRVDHPWGEVKWGSELLLLDDILAKSSRRDGIRISPSKQV